jgi:hypothetical protein
LNQSAQLDSSLIYTKERHAGDDQDLDDDDKELLMDQTEHFIEKRPNLYENAEPTEEWNTHSQKDQVAELVISADKLIMFQEQRPEDDQSNEALNMAVVVESAPGD